MAVSAEGVKQGLIHHSDRGIPYCCTDYVNYLKGSNINISMTENGDPYENALAERVNGILKDEYELNQTFADYHAALEATKTAVYKYNNKRPHSNIDLMFPVNAHHQNGILKKHWKKREFRAKQKPKINLSVKAGIKNHDKETIRCYFPVCQDYPGMSSNTLYKPGKQDKSVTTRK